MRVKQLPVLAMIGVAYAIVWCLQNTTNEDGEMFPGLPFTP